MGPYSQQVSSADIQQRIREWLDPRLPYGRMQADATDDLATALGVSFVDISTALATLERSKTYRYERRGLAVTRVSKGANFQVPSAATDSKPRSLCGRVLIELRKNAVRGTCRLKKPAVYLSGRIHGLSVSEAQDVLCELHNAGVISVFPAKTGEAEIVIGEHTELIDHTAQELVESVPAKAIPIGNIYVLLERLVACCEGTGEELESLRDQMADDAAQAAKQATHTAELSGECERLRRENAELALKVQPSNRQRREMRRLGLLE